MWYFATWVSLPLVAEVSFILVLWACTSVFSYVASKLIHSRYSYLRSPFNTLTTELAILGFITFLFLLFSKWKILQQANDYLLGRTHTEEVAESLHPFEAPPTTLSEIFEDVHVIVFVLMVVLITLGTALFFLVTSLVGLADDDDVYSSQLAPFSGRFKGHQGQEVIFPQPKCEQNECTYQAYLQCVLASELTSILKIPIRGLLFLGILAGLVLPLTLIREPIGFLLTVNVLSYGLLGLTFYWARYYQEAMESLRILLERNSESTTDEAQPFFSVPTPQLFPRVSEKKWAQFLRRVDENEVPVCMARERLMSKMLTNRVDILLPGKSVEGSRRKIRFLFLLIASSVTSLLRSQISWASAPFWVSGGPITNIIWRLLPYGGPVVSIYMMANIILVHVVLVSSDMNLTNSRIINARRMNRDRIEDLSERVGTALISVSKIWMMQSSKRTSDARVSDLEELGKEESRFENMLEHFLQNVRLKKDIDDEFTKVWQVLSCGKLTISATSWMTFLKATRLIDHPARRAVVRAYLEIKNVLTENEFRSVTPFIFSSVASKFTSPSALRQDRLDVLSAWIDGSHMRWKQLKPYAKDLPHLSESELNSYQSYFSKSWEMKDDLIRQDTL